MDLKLNVLTINFIEMDQDIGIFKTVSWKPFAYLFLQFNAQITQNDLPSILRQFLFRKIQNKKGEFD